MILNETRYDNDAISFLDSWNVWDHMGGLAGVSGKYSPRWDASFPSWNLIMTSNNVIGDIQASRKSTGDECSIIQRHERTHYHHVIMTWCLLWIMLIAFDSFGLLVFCACRLASGVVVLSSVWVRYYALLECSCLVRFSISCTACWELFVWAICFLMFF